VTLSQVAGREAYQDFRYWVERQGLFPNGLPTSTISFGASVHRDPARGSTANHSAVPAVYRDVPEAVESGGLAGEMDAA
jgi:hypothetical protein